LLQFLRYCVESEIVHGDLKPRNVGVTQDGLLVVFDWEPHIRGTQGYCAPEMQRDKSLDPSFESDLYFAGFVFECLRSHLCSGNRRFEQEDLMEIINVLKSENPQKRREALQESRMDILNIDTQS
jgi:serine/threonine protein kinase